MATSFRIMFISNTANVNATHSKVRGAHVRCAEGQPHFDMNCVCVDLVSFNFLRTFSIAHSYTVLLIDNENK